MPKLPKKIAKTVQSSEQVSTEFELLPDGKYVGTLAEVTVEDNKNYPNNVSTWVARFNKLKNYRTGKSYPGSQWYRMSVIIDDSMPGNYEKGEDKWETYVRMSNGQMKAFFENMGFTADSDTDEMIGEMAMINIGHRTNQGGKRQGEVSNEVRGVVEFPEDFDEDEFANTADEALASDDKF